VVCSGLQWITVGYGVLQLQSVALCYSLLEWVAVCCSLLKSCAVVCSVLQSIAVCCNVLQYVVVCCSVLQCKGHPQSALVRDSLLLPFRYFRFVFCYKIHKFMNTHTRMDTWMCLYVDLCACVCICGAYMLRVTCICVYVCRSIHLWLCTTV